MEGLRKGGKITFIYGHHQTDSDTIKTFTY